MVCPRCGSYNISFTTEEIPAKYTNSKNERIKRRLSIIATLGIKLLFEDNSPRQQTRSECQSCGHIFVGE